MYHNLLNFDLVPLISYLISYRLCTLNMLSIIFIDFLWQGNGKHESLPPLKALKASGLEKNIKAGGEVLKQHF